MESIEETPYKIEPGVTEYGDLVYLKAKDIKPPSLLDIALANGKTGEDLRAGLMASRTNTD